MSLSLFWLYNVSQYYICYNVPQKHILQLWKDMGWISIFGWTIWTVHPFWRILVTKQFWFPLLFFVPLTEDNGSCNCLAINILQNIYFLLHRRNKSYRFGVTYGWVNIFGWTIPLQSSFHSIQSGWRERNIIPTANQQTRTKSYICLERQT